MNKNFLLLINYKGIPNTAKRKVYWYLTEDEIKEEIIHLKLNGIEFDAFDIATNKIYQNDGFKTL